MSLDYVATYPSFRFDRPSDGVLRITLDPPGLNAVSPGAHREIAEVCRSTDGDPEVRVAVLQGAGKGFSAGRELRSPRGHHRRLRGAYPRHA
jgi:enoyl-CoA hydratase